MLNLYISVALFIVGLVGLLVCLFASLDGDDYPMAAVIALLCAVLGWREIKFELYPEAE